METTFNQKRFRTLIKAVRIFSLVAMGLFILTSVLAVVAFAAGLIISDDFLTFNLSELTVHQYFDLQLEAYLSEDILDSDITLTSIMVSGGLRAFVGSMFLAGLFYLVKRIMIQVEAARPFSPAVADSLRWIAYGFIAAGIVLPVFDFLFMRSIVEQVDHEYLNASYSLNLGFVFIGALFYILMRIFEYGVFLQTQYDETV